MQCRPYLSCLLQKVVLDHVLEIDGCSGDVWGPYSSKARKNMLKRRKEEKQMQKERKQAQKEKADKVRRTAFVLCSWVAFVTYTSPVLPARANVVAQLAL